MNPPPDITTMQEAQRTTDPGRCLETRVTASVNAEALIALIPHPAFLGGWEDDGVLRLYWDPSVWSEEIFASLQEALRQLGIYNAEITVHEIHAQDWNARWAASVQPIRIGRRLVIRPTWHPVPVSGQEIELILDPKQAFGTGHHATTQLLLEWLDDHIRGGEHVLDVGTGSGILAMAALRFGAAFALGVDHDPTALACAWDYAVLNHFGKELVFRHGTLADLPSQPFGVILANLDCRTIISHYEQFYRVAHKHTVLLLSGILLDDRQIVIQAGAAHGWKPFWSRTRDGWLAVGLRRTAQG
ncbi:MAG: 50S ribosomal protein L11 methyltransferase [Nitrospirae bacterium]|nr:MAG: 50S ribosomal protein L11 methyltransferase [Nitrospirota bacterium]